MAKMHWFILGGMFTEIKPDSVKEKYMLQHEKPYPLLQIFLSSV